MEFAKRISFVILALMLSLLAIILTAFGMTSRYEQGFKDGQASVISVAPTIPEPSASPSAVMVSPSAVKSNAVKRGLQQPASVSPTVKPTVKKAVQTVSPTVIPTVKR